MATDDFFRSRLDTMIDLRHPLAVLATRMPWDLIEQSLAPLLAHKDRAGRTVEGADLFGPTLAVAGGGVSPAGRPRLPVRLMVSLLYLKHAFNESDESLVERWSENVYWQFFSGMTFYEPKLPCDPAQISRFRRVLGEAGVEQLLKTTIEAAVAMNAAKPKDFERVIVDTPVQEKAIAHPTDSRLLEVAREKITRLAKRVGITLKQTFAKEGQMLRRKAGGYAEPGLKPSLKTVGAWRRAGPLALRGLQGHAKQFRRLRKVVKRQRTILGIVLRDVRRKMTALPEAQRVALTLWLERAERIQAQQPKDKNKLYALHAPEVECIGKGKARKPFEFGVKASIAISHAKGLIVGARSFPGNPYDGHTLAEQLEQTANLLQDLGVKPTTAVVDLGFRGVDKDIAPVQSIHRGKFKSLTTLQKRWLKRRQAVERPSGT